MIFGFNTDLRVGKTVYHIQTEDRGELNPVIDTTIYCKGRILHRRAISYKEFRESPEFSADGLRRRLEDQHRAVIDELRSGALGLEQPPAAPAPCGIQVQLLNPASWVAAGTATMKLEVKSKGGGEAIEGAALRVTLTGVKGPVTFSTQSDTHGRAELSFPLPHLGPGGTEVVIQASSPAGEDEIRYSLKPRSRLSQS